MNKERLTILADLIEGGGVGDIGFHMCTVAGVADDVRQNVRMGYPTAPSLPEGACGTYMCIAGHALQLWESATVTAFLARKYDAFDSWDHAAAGVLNLDPNVALELFCNFPHRHATDNKKAARVIRHLRDNGVVDWSV